MFKTYGKASENSHKIKTHIEKNEKLEIYYN